MFSGSYLALQSSMAYGISDSNLSSSVFRGQITDLERDCFSS